MILTYKQCIEKYGSDYMLKKEIEENVFMGKLESYIKSKFNKLHKTRLSVIKGDHNIALYKLLDVYVSIN